MFDHDLGFFNLILTRMFDPNGKAWTHTIGTYNELHDTCRGRYCECLCATACVFARSFSIPRSIDINDELCLKGCFAVDWPDWHWKGTSHTRWRVRSKNCWRGYLHVHDDVSDASITDSCCIPGDAGSDNSEALCEARAHHAKTQKQLKLCHTLLREGSSAVHECGDFWKVST